MLALRRFNKTILSKNKLYPIAVKKKKKKKERKLLRVHLLQ